MNFQLIKQARSLATMLTLTFVGFSGLFADWTDFEQQNNYAAKKSAICQAVVTYNAIWKNSSDEQKAKIVSVEIVSVMNKVMRLMEAIEQYQRQNSSDVTASREAEELREILAFLVKLVEPFVKDENSGYSRAAKVGAGLAVSAAAAYLLKRHGLDGVKHVGIEALSKTASIAAKGGTLALSGGAKVANAAKQGGALVLSGSGKAVNAAKQGGALVLNGTAKAVNGAKTALHTVWQHPYITALALGGGVGGSVAYNRIGAKGATPDPVATSEPSTSTPEQAVALAPVVLPVVESEVTSANQASTSASVVVAPAVMLPVVEGGVTSSKQASISASPATSVAPTKVGSSHAGSSSSASMQAKPKPVVRTGATPAKAKPNIPAQKPAKGKQPALKPCVKCGKIHAASSSSVSMHAVQKPAKGKPVVGRSTASHLLR